jgi:hypothetical protein
VVVVVVVVVVVGWVTGGVGVAGEAGAAVEFGLFVEIKADDVPLDSTANQAFSPPDRP